MSKVAELRRFLNEIEDDEELYYIFKYLAAGGGSWHLVNYDKDLAKIEAENGKVQSKSFIIKHRDVKDFLYDIYIRRKSLGIGDWKIRYPYK